jgi:hypothetical protein
MVASLINVLHSGMGLETVFENLTGLSQALRLEGRFSLLWNASTLTTHALKRMCLQAVAL